jgi:DNA-directed RNA polymerase specialized sigma24 family protein
MQLQTSGEVGGSKLSSVNNLYNNYAGMLLGYLFEVVKSRPVAEQYLMLVFNDVPNEIEEFYKPGVNAFCHLQSMARKKLADFFENTEDQNTRDAVQNNVFIVKNKFIKEMTPDQQLVFCGAHWHGKTISKIAAEMKKPEDAVRILLKECFTIIRAAK